MWFKKVKEHKPEELLSYDKFYFVKNDSELFNKYDIIRVLWWDDSGFDNLDIIYCENITKNLKFNIKSVKKFNKHFQLIENDRDIISIMRIQKIKKIKNR